MRLCGKRDEEWIMRAYSCMLDKPIDFAYEIGLEGELLPMVEFRGEGAVADSSLIHYSNMHGVLSI
jgi:hypothetical protein